MSFRLDLLTKEYKPMDLLNKIDLMIDDAIAKARNEGFAEGVKWHKVQTSPTERAFVADGGPTIEENDTPFCVREGCDCDNANPNDPIIEEYDNDGRYERYNDDVWPGENQAEEGDGE